MVKNRTAENLEKKGLWRRAATCWLSIMDHCHTAEEQDWVRRRRNYCTAHIKRTKHSSGLDPAKVHRSVSTMINNIP